MSGISMGKNYLRDDNAPFVVTVNEKSYCVEIRTRRIPRYPHLVERLAYIWKGNSPKCEVYLLKEAIRSQDDDEVKYYFLQSNQANGKTGILGKKFLIPPEYDVVNESMGGKGFICMNSCEPVEIFNDTGNKILSKNQRIIDGNIKYRSGIAPETATDADMETGYYTIEDTSESILVFHDPRKDKMAFILRWTGTKDWKNR